MKRLIDLENLILLSVFLLPTYLVRIHWGWFSTNLWELLAVVSWIWFIIDQNRRIKDFKASKSLLLLIILLFLSLLVSAFLGSDNQKSFGIVKGWFLFPIAFSALSLFVIGKDNSRKIFDALLLSAFGVALISLGYWIFGERTFDGRLEGIFNSPNYLAMYLAPGILLAVDRLLSFGAEGVVRKKKWEKQAIYLIIIVILAVLYLTKAYWAWISLFLSLIFSLAFLPRIRVKLSRRVALAFLVVGVIFISFQIRSDKFSSIISLDERSSFSSRMIIWNSAGKIIEDNPVFGIGAGNFQEKYLEYQKFFPPYLEWAVPHAHNLFLEFYLSSGLVGLIAFVGLIFIWAIPFLKGGKETRSRSLELFFLAYMAWIVLNGLLDTTYFKNDLAVVFWLVYLFSFPKALSCRVVRSDD